MNIYNDREKKEGSQENHTLHRTAVCGRSRTKQNRVGESLYSVCLLSILKVRFTSPQALLGLVQELGLVPVEPHPVSLVQELGPELGLVQLLPSSLVQQVSFPVLTDNQPTRRSAKLRKDLKE